MRSTSTRSTSTATEEPRRRTQEEFQAEMNARLAKQRREDARRKADALAAGKEPFDLDRFFEFYIMESPPSEARRESSTANWERDYYGQIGERFTTIEDFAKYLNEIDVYLH